MPDFPAHGPLLAWYADHARDLPWRRPDATPWAILVSEVMLQQTQVSRVLPVYDAWLARWPTPRALAREPAGEAIRMWGRLGYPRRALRLHQTAVAIAHDLDGVVPSDLETLRALPGIGEYTAAAIAAFAYRQRVAALDTNVRRVLSRLFLGTALPPHILTTGQRHTAHAVLPDDAETAATWSVALMELGALICTARAPDCAHCPVADLCAWRTEGYPPSTRPTARTQRYEGTDRQCRGTVLDVLRVDAEPVPVVVVRACWDDVDQLDQAVSTLLEDGLVVLDARRQTLALP